MESIERELLKGARGQSQVARRRLQRDGRRAFEEQPVEEGGRLLQKKDMEQAKDLKDLAERLRDTRRRSLIRPIRPPPSGARQGLRAAQGGARRGIDKEEAR